jgi:hypothetical protein
VPGRDIFVQAWYQGGISVIDFTDSANPVEIAYFDRGPIDEEDLIMGGFWSVYYYRGLIYGTEIVRGLDVLALTAGEHLSENEIAAAALADQGAAFNPQQQFQVTWPAEPAVALAYLDQLGRDEAVPAAFVTEVTSALDLSAATLDGGSSDRRLAGRLSSLAAEALKGTRGDTADGKRRAALAGTLNDIAARLR